MPTTWTVSPLCTEGEATPRSWTTVELETLTVTVASLVVRLKPLALAAETVPVLRASGTTTREAVKVPVPVGAPAT